MDMLHTLKLRGIPDIPRVLIEQVKPKPQTLRGGAGAGGGGARIGGGLAPQIEIRWSIGTCFLFFTHFPNATLQSYSF